MAADLLSDPAAPGDGGPRRPKRSPVTFGRVLVVIGVLLAIALIYMVAVRVTVSDRPNDMKTTTVVLPPPPPTPPPPPETQPIEKPPEPTIAPPLEQPVDTPPPPEASNDPVQGDSALTAREGAGPSNYGLARGDGGGTRIGGRPGGTGDGFAAYAGVVSSAIRVAAQSDRELARGRYTIRLLVTVNAEGRVTAVRVLDSSGDRRRDDRVREVLMGLQISTRPPPGLPPMRLELATRSGA